MRRRRARLHLQDGNIGRRAIARRDFAGLQVDDVAVVGGSHFEQSFEQRNRGRVVLGSDVELRALHHTDEEWGFDAQLASTAFADVVERVAARLHDAIDGSAAAFRAREIPAVSPGRR